MKQTRLHPQEACMKRLCVFYKHANRWVGKPVKWIVCKECRAKVVRGKLGTLLVNAVLNWSKGE